MDGKTFDRIVELRQQAQDVANEHNPPEDQEHNGYTPEQRFKDLGRTVMNGQPWVHTRDNGGKLFRQFARLPNGVTIALEAETWTDHPTVDDLVTVRAKWSAGSVQHSLHVDSVSNISDRHGVDDHDLRKLALVEESFAEARAHLRE